MNTAFRTRWVWNLRAEEQKACCELACPVDERVRQVFYVAARVVVGNGERIYFWTDKWIHGKTIEEIAPDVFLSINPEIKARRTMAQALKHGKWIE